MNEHQQSIQNLFNHASRIVIKIGSALVVDEQTLRPHREWLESLAYDIRKLCDQEKDVIVVASGAVALGKERADLMEKHPLTPRDKRLASTIGARKHANAITAAFSVADVEAEYVVVSVNLMSSRVVLVVELPITILPLVFILNA